MNRARLTGNSDPAALPSTVAYDFPRGRRSEGKFPLVCRQPQEHTDSATKAKPTGLLYVCCKYDVDTDLVLLSSTDGMHSRLTKTSVEEKIFTPVFFLFVCFPHYN